MTIHHDPPPASSAVPTGLKRVVVASMAGTVVEWYEFFLYATAATLVFNKVFFAEGSGDSALIVALLTYGVGFLAGPLGGVVFGHFGDKYGRKKLLQFSLLLVGGVTLLMGCLPTYGEFGTWVPIAIYLAAAAVITLVAALFMRETNGIDLESLDEADREDLAKAGVI